MHSGSAVRLCSTLFLVTVTQVPNRATQYQRMFVCLRICGVLSEAGAWLFQSVLEIGYGLTALGIAVRSPKGTETFIFSTSSRTAPGSTQSLRRNAYRKGVGGGGRMKMPTREAHHSLSTKDIEKNRWLCTSVSHTYSCMVINWRCGKRDVYMITRSTVTTMHVRTTRVKRCKLIGGNVKERGHRCDPLYI